MALRRFKQHYIWRVRRFGVKSARLGLIKFKGWLSRIILIGVVAACFLPLRQWSYNFFRTSAFFNVSKIELAMRPHLKEALSLDFYNIPRHSNIFQLDIDAIGAGVQKEHPEFQSVVVLRKPPNVISVRIRYKQPVAFIKTSRGLVPIAVDGVVLPPEAAPQIGLPVFTGVDFKTPVTKVGDACCDKKLPYGIKFLTTVQYYWTIKEHTINTVDLSNIRDISIFLENGIKVRMGEGGIKDKLDTLKNIVEKSSFDLEKIKYIDLRFSDVIIGSK